jgi:hypothetical protein
MLTTSSYAPGASDDADPFEEEKIERRLRCAVQGISSGSESIDLGKCAIGDEEVKLLVRMLRDMEEAVRGRLEAAKIARAAADREIAEKEAAKFRFFEPDHPGGDEEERAYREGCSVVWEDDPIVATAAGSEATVSIDENLPPPSYRFTPREERVGFGGEGGRLLKSVHSKGRAKIIFRHALQRHTLRQKALIAAAAWAQMDYEEGGTGCHHLCLQGNQLGSLSAAHLGSLMRSSETIETLALGQNALGDAGAALLGRALQSARSLRTLALQDCGIGPKGIRHLCSGLARNRSVSKLWLYGNRAGERAAHV